MGCLRGGLLVVLMVVGVVVGLPVSDKPPCKFSAMFNFGDSNSDTGGISAAFEPIRWPYGQTFFKKPAGRDSDGRVLVDFIAEELGLPYLSAYLNSIGANFRHGANFATGGSTIRRQNETIFQNGISPFSLDVQIWQHDQFKSRTKDLYKQVKNPFEKSLLPRPEEFSKALYTFDIGQNDLSVAFRTMNDEQPRATIPNIISQFSSAVQYAHLKLLGSLYMNKEQGRSGYIIPVQLVACPYHCFTLQIQSPDFSMNLACIKGHNDMAIEFNKQLRDAVTKLRTQLPEAAVTYVDLYSAKYGLISKTKSQGWADPMKVCCGYHEKYDHVWCGQKGVIANGTTVFGAVCKDPELHVSWDGVHHTEGANHWFANHILNGSLTDPPTPIIHACYRN